MPRGRCWGRIASWCGAPPPAIAASARSQDRPQLCPDPSAESTAGRSERALAYQQQITGLKPGLEVKLNGVRFDGCREEDGTMLEAKSPGFTNKMDTPDEWQDWFTGERKIESQMQNQSAAASDRTVEWHFAEEPVAEFFRGFAERNEFTNIIVLYTPAASP